MFIQNVPTPNTLTISPYGNFLDISSKEQKLLWREMIKLTNHTLVDMNISNSRVIINLFQYKAITYHWQHYMRIPTKGTGAPGYSPGTTPGGCPVFDADLSNFKYLIKDFNHLSLDQVMAFTSWFMGDVNKPLKTCIPSDMTMRYLNVNVGGNAGLVACFKQECCTVSCLDWYYQESLLHFFV